MVAHDLDLERDWPELYVPCRCKPCDRLRVSCHDDWGCKTIIITMSEYQKVTLDQCLSYF